MVSLVDTLGRVRQRLAECVEFASHERARAGDRRKARHAMRRRLGTVRRAESVVYVDVAERRDLARQCLVVGLLALVDAAVLEQYELAGLHLDAVDPVRAHGHRAPEQFSDAGGDRRERVLGAQHAFLRPPEVRGHHDRSTGLERTSNRRQRCADAAVIADLAVFHRHVQIGANQHPLALQVHVLHALERHDVGLPFPIASSRRGIICCGSPDS
jgi:hypothetical protein